VNILGLEIRRPLVELANGDVDRLVSPTGLEL